MKNYILTFVLALLVVLTGMTLRRSVAGIGTASMAPASTSLAIGGSPVPLPPDGLKAIGGSPVPLPPDGRR